MNRSDLEPVVSSSSSWSAYDGEETREADYLWVDNKVRQVFSKYTEASMLQTFADSVYIILEGFPNCALALCRCREYETVCLGRGEKLKIFYFFFILV